MLWLLPYFGYALAASAVASAAGYAAVTRFSVVQRVLIAALDRTLGRVTDSKLKGGHTYHLERSDTGVIITDIVAGQEALRSAQAAGTQLASFTVQRLEVDFPSFSRPLAVRISGIRACLQQMQLPKYTPPEDISSADRKSRRDDKRRRLDVIEEILWKKGTATPTGHGWNPAGAYLGRLQARALQKFVAFLAQFAVVDARDIEIQYTQRGEPGPRPSSNYLQGADAAILQVRCLLLQPQGTSAGRGGDNDNDDDDTIFHQHKADSTSSTPMGSPRAGVGGSGGHNIKIGFGGSSGGSGESSEEPTMLQALASIPQLLWSNVITHRPSATELSMNGINLILKTYPSTWRGYHAAIAAAAAAQSPSKGPFVFTSPNTKYAVKSPGAHRGRGKNRQLIDAEVDHTTTKRRRADDGSDDVIMMDRSDGDGSSNKTSSASPSKQKNTTTTASSSSTATPPFVNYAAMLKDSIAEEHIIIKQWEFSILICLLPPGYAKEDVSSFVSPFTTTDGTATPSEQQQGEQSVRGDDVAAALSNASTSTTGHVPHSSSSQHHGAVGRTRSSFLGGRSTRRRFNLRGVSSRYSNMADLDAILSGGIERIDDGKRFLQDVVEEERLTDSDVESIESTEFLTPAASIATSRASSRDSSPARGTKGKQENGVHAMPAAEAIAKSLAEGMPGSTTEKNKASTSSDTNTTTADTDDTTSTTPDALQYMLDVSITLKAFVPELNAASGAILSRVVDRQLHFKNYGAHWACRPQVSVENNEAAWWQHAGRAIAAGTRKLSRREVPLSKLEQRRAMRLEYQELYAATHANSPFFKEPGRQWWQFSQIKSSNEQDKKRLAALEDALTLEELAHFRFGVAARYNSQLAEDSKLTHFIADKIDALVCTKRSSMQPHLADLLLHRDREAMHFGGTFTSTDDSKKKKKVGKRDDRVMFGAKISINCPKIGIAVDMRHNAATPVATDEPRYIVLALKNVGMELHPHGSMQLTVKELECGPAALPTSSPDTRLLASPSRVCQDVCKAAEFFRYAMTGNVISQSIRQDAHVCAKVMITPRYGVGGRAVGESADSGHAIENWHPAGFNISVELAAMGIVYDNASATALLAFAGHWEEYKRSPWSWSLPGVHSDSSDTTTAASTSSNNNTSSNTATMNSSQWPPLLKKPQTVEGMVLSTYSAAQVPVLGTLLLPVTNLEVNCPGIAVQLPYMHQPASLVLRKKWKNEEQATSPISTAKDKSRTSNSGNADESASSSHTTKATSPDDDTLDDAPENLQYMFTVALQNIKVRVAGDDFAMAFKGGSARRIEAEGFLDIFSYLSVSARRVIARRLGRGRFIFDAVRRMFTEETSSVDAIEEELREMEIPCMAKVWAYPEDMPLIVKAVRERGYFDGEAPPSAAGAHAGTMLPSLMSAYSMRSAPTSTSSYFKGEGGGGTSTVSGLRQSMPDLLNKPDMYPIPLIPYLKAKPIRGSVVHRLSAMPDDPGGSVLAAATSINGTQVWVSPIHIWHLISLERAIQRIIDYFSRSSIIESMSSSSSSTTETSKEKKESEHHELSAPRPNRRLLFTFDIQAVSLLWLIGTWTRKGQNIVHSPHFSRSWGIFVKKGDPAFLWAQWIAPVYSASLIQVAALLRVQQNGEVFAGLSVNGVIVRDLQLPDVAKHAYVLRPLPARARRLNNYLHEVRRLLLGITQLTQVKHLWLTAFSKAFLRRRTGTTICAPFNRIDPGAPQNIKGNVVFGPQFVVRFINRGHAMYARQASTRPQAELTVEVGQMLAYVRIKQQASMTAFATQLSQIFNNFGSASGRGDKTQKERKDEKKDRQSTAIHSGFKLQSSLRVDVMIVGIDILFRVQSRDLMSLKLQQGKVTVDRKAVTRASSPSDISLHISGTLQDIMIQDMRAAPEHALVLIPNQGAECCSLDAVYTAQVDSRHRPPCLVLDIQNPRVVLLFRFVSDILNAMGIIQSAVSKRKASGTSTNPHAVQFAADQDGTTNTSRIAAGATVTAAAAAASHTSNRDSKPLEIVVQLRNVGLIVPTSTYGKSVLAGTLDHFMLALPVSALPVTLLEEADLPSVPDMLRESITSNRTYKFSGFHDGPSNHAHESGGVDGSATATGGKGQQDKKADSSVLAPDVTVAATSEGKRAADQASSSTTAASKQQSSTAASDAVPQVQQGVFKKKKYKTDRQAGVLFFEEDDEDDAPKPLAGLLHIDTTGEAGIGGGIVGTNLDPTTGNDDEYMEDFTDNVLAAPAAVAKHVVGAAKNFVGTIVSDVMDLDIREGDKPISSQKHQVVMQRPESRESGTQNSGAARQKDGLRANITALDDEDEYIDDVELPPSKLACCIENFEVVIGTLVRVPNYFRKTANNSRFANATANNSRQGSFVPPSLMSFSWPSDVYEVVTRGPFLNPANLGMVIFDRYYGDTKAIQLHLSATPLSFVLSAPNYTTLMDFVYGNLADFKTTPVDEDSSNAGVGGSTADATHNAMDGGGDTTSDHASASSSKPSVETRFNPSMKFGPEPGSIPTFRMTLAVPEVAVVFMAHPREWTDVSPEYLFAGSSDCHMLRPFFHAIISNLLMDLGTMSKTRDVYINFCANGVEIEDLRLGYRLTEVSARVPTGTEYEIGDAPVPPVQQWGRGASSSSSSGLFNSTERDPRGAVLESILLNHAEGSTDAVVIPTPFSDAQADFATASSGGSIYGSPLGSIDSQSMLSVASDVDTPHTPSSGRAATAAEAASVFRDSGSDHKSRRQTVSVARRLSEHSHHRHKAMSDSHGDDRSTPGADKRDRAALDLFLDTQYVPVLDFINIEDPSRPSTMQNETATLRIITAPYKPPEEERLPVDDTTMFPGSNPDVKIEVSVAVLADSTTAVEIALSSVLLQWPYFQDLSLIHSLSNVFKTPTIEERMAANDDAAEPPTNKDKSVGAKSWLYINTVFTETQLFVPVLDAEVAEHLARELWDAPLSRTASGMNPFSTPVGDASQYAAINKSEFQRIADLALATMLLDSTGSPGALALEERGLAITTNLLRFAYAAGGDGESVLCIDCRDLAAFIRDPRARVNSILQPFSCSVEIKSQVPEAAEQKEMERMNSAATLIQRCWRRYQTQRTLRNQGLEGDSVLPAMSAMVHPHRHTGMKRSFSANDVSNTGASSSADRGAQWKLVDKLVMDVASPHTRSLLSKYKKSSQDRMQMMYLSQFRAISTTSVQIKTGALTVRAAFSHIPFWQAALDSVQRVVMQTKDEESIMTPSASQSSIARDLQPALHSGTMSVMDTTRESKPFRPHILHISSKVESITAVLCNDRPETFGAPDVLQLSVTEASLGFDSSTLLPDRPANKAGRLILSTYASYLNSGTSRWEPLFDMWPVTAEYVDVNSAMYISDRLTNLWIISDGHLNATFNPASLMSFGDGIAFINAFADRSTVDGPPTPLPNTNAILDIASSLVARRTSEPPTRQLSLSLTLPKNTVSNVTGAGMITSRAPQKYLVQNQSGMRLFYWADVPNPSNPSHTGRTPVFMLENGASETLRVAPASKRMNFVQFTTAITGTERLGSVINLHFEGNWMPVRDVAVNVVGKYKYRMLSPADNTTVPVIVDIILVGRTKIITLHSGIWVENCISKPINFRLHIPTTPLVPPPSASSLQGDTSHTSTHPHHQRNASQNNHTPPPPLTTVVDGSISIGPLAPKAGCYLPLTAALGGLLFLQPEGYAEASRDVIRLGCSVEDLIGQQGYITCEPLADAHGADGPLHVAMEATPSRVLSEFQAFKHMECVALGTIQRATSPLEVTVSIQPTMVISNSLPYEMRVLLWQVAPSESGSSAGPSSTMKWSKNSSKEKKAEQQTLTPTTSLTPATEHHASLLEMLSPRAGASIRQLQRVSTGRYFSFRIPPGGEHSVYVDMRQHVLMHVSVEEINMRTTKWSFCSWAQRVHGRGDSKETQYAAKLPKDVQLRMVGVGMPLPTNLNLIPDYLMRLKEAASMLRTVHAQFNRDARMAATAEDIQEAVAKIKALARRMGHKKGSKYFSRSAMNAHENTKDGRTATSARPVPSRAKAPALSPPAVQGGVVKKKVALFERWGRRAARDAEVASTNKKKEEATAAAAPPHAGDVDDKGKAPVVVAETEMVTVQNQPPSSPPKTNNNNNTNNDNAENEPSQQTRRTLRPPPLEITEEPNLFGNTHPGLAATPFDVWRREAVHRPTADPFNEEEDAEARAPPILRLGVHNSLMDKELPQAGVCRITLFVPYWLSNRTGVDLFFKDPECAPPNPFVFGAPLPWGYGEVFAPGTSMTDAFDKENSIVDDGDGVAGNSNSKVNGGVGGGMSSWIHPQAASFLGGSMNNNNNVPNQALLEYKLVLMNKQDELALGLAHVQKRRYSQPVHIKTVGNKGCVELRGPPSKQSTHRKAFDAIRKTAENAAAAAAHAPAAAAEILHHALASGSDHSQTQVEDSGLSVDPRRVSRHSIGQQMVDVVATRPGTMLVRLTSADQPTTSTRKMPSIIRYSPSPMQGRPSMPEVGGVGMSIDAEVDAVLDNMQKVPPARQDVANLENPENAPAPSRQQLSEAMVGSDSKAGRLPGSPSGSTVKKSAVSLGSGGGSGAVNVSDVDVNESSSQKGSLTTSPSMTAKRFIESTSGLQEAAEVAAIHAAVAKRSKAIATKGMRLFEFAVEVSAGPRESIYRHTKLVTLKPKYIIENQTGLMVDVKQLGTKDPEEDGTTHNASHRFARTLAPGQRAAVYWDDAELSKELVVRPRLPGESYDAWNWSGGFPIPDSEWYFGLRIRHKVINDQRYINIPVNVTIGAAGSVQVTLKNPASVPPYRIENMCKDVQLYCVQVPLVFREEGKLYMDGLKPGDVMPYAWDEPTMLTKLRVQAKVIGRATEARVADFSLDKLGDAPMMLLPTHGETAPGTAARRIYKTLSTDLPEDLKKKLASLLAAEFSKKVYVTVYADGPTRVLRFSDDKNLSSLEQQNVVLDLAARLKQVERQLRVVNSQFARLSGVSGVHSWALDLYGRLPVTKEEPASSIRGPAQRRASRKLAVPESTAALVHRASRSLQYRSSSALNLESPSLVAGGRAMESPAAVQKPFVRFNTNIHQEDDGGASGSNDRRREKQRKDSGVLHIEEGSDDEDLPYRHLVIRTNTSDNLPATAAAIAAAASEDLLVDNNNNLGGGDGNGNDSDGNDGDKTSLPHAPSSRGHRRGESVDWGHILTDMERQGTAGTRSMGRKANTNAAAELSPAEATSNMLARRQELLRLVADSDAVLLIGGDLNITVVQARNLNGVSRTTHPFARVYVKDPIPPTSADEDRAKQTSVSWQTIDPVWDEQLMFRDVCVASELVVELWDLGGTKQTTQLTDIGLNSAEMIKQCRFLGRAEVPLSETLEIPAGSPVWFTLMRRSAADMVSGELELRFLWDVTARGLLNIKLTALERVLAQRREILAALQPVPVQTALKWQEANPLSVSAAREVTGFKSMSSSSALPKNNNTTSYSSLHALGMNIFGSSYNAAAVQPSQVAAEVLTRHSNHHNKKHLVVTVLEARGLNPRRGVVVALSANELPNPVVTLKLQGYPEYVTPVLQHTLNPRWPANRRHIFRDVDPNNASMTVTLHDQRGGMLQRAAMLGKGMIHASNLYGENPVYVWVPLGNPRKKAQQRNAAANDADAVPELQVFLRLQWQTESTRGSSTRIEIDASGVGLMVVGGLQDELFNITVESIKTTSIRTRQELTLSGSIARVQIDNQMLNAVEPVVLAPDISAHLSGATTEGPLITFGFVRSFAGSGTSQAFNKHDQHPGDADAQELTTSISASDLNSVAPTTPGSTTQLDAHTGAIAPSAGGLIHYTDSRGIRSFKDIYLNIAPMDLMTDEAFLEAVLSFLTSVPVGDIWQDKAWQEQQRRLLTAQFGPREVESLAINAAVTPAMTGEDVSPASALTWVLQKEAKDLEALHGQSDLSSWFFIENAQIGTVMVNVTVSLSSRVLAAGQGLSTAGAFNSALGASGYQLVNVSNIPISLGRWIVGNDPSIRGRFSNGFLSQRALMSNLVRHYSREGLKEAHKVLGGAGPAVASVPLTVLWASGSTYVLLKEVTMGNTGPLGALQQGTYVPLMTFSMFISGFARMFAAGMAVIPPERDAGDDETVRRIIKRPNNTLDALASAPKELVWGMKNAVLGVVLDPVTGWHNFHVLGFVWGAAKGTVGLGIRPVIGSLEFSSRIFAAFALSVLGRDGIVGKVQRRVRAPGAFADDGIDGMEDGPRTEAQARAKALQAAWQRVLPEYFPEMAGDTVTDVINVRATRMILITNHHIAYLKVRHLREHSVFKAKWLVPIMEIQTIRGDPESRKISISHVHKYNLRMLGVWPVQLRKGLRCGSRPLYEKTLMRLTKVQQVVQGGGALEDQGAGKAFVGANVSELTILSAPYQPPEKNGGRKSIR